jgi:hypothetical protein
MRVVALMIGLTIVAATCGYVMAYQALMVCL